MSKYRLCAIGLLLLSSIGCSSKMMHELQPHRLWRLNRGPAPGNGAMYSIEAEPLVEVVDVQKDSLGQNEQQ